MFDKSKPHSRVDGDSLACYYQGGQYYDHAGKPLSHAEAAKPAPGGMFESAVDVEIARRAQPSESQLNETVKINDPQNPQNRRKPKPAAKPKAPESDKPPSTSPDPRLAQLQGLTLKQLNEAVTKAGGEAFKGRLAKSKAVNYLLENTAT